MREACYNPGPSRSAVASGSAGGRPTYDASADVLSRARDHVRKLIPVGGVLVGLGLAALAFGCGGSSKGQDVPASGPKYSNAQVFCDAIAAAECTPNLANLCQ